MSAVSKSQYEYTIIREDISEHRCESFWGDVTERCYLGIIEMLGEGHCDDATDRMLIR